MSAKRQITLFQSDKHISVRESHFDVHSCTTYSYTLRLYVLLETFFFFYIYLKISACNKGLFGVDCNEKCGQCREVYQCHHKNGTCLAGCAAGYLGNMCKTRM